MGRNATSTVVKSPMRLQPTEVLSLASSLYIEENNFLQFGVWASAASLQVTFSWQMLRPDGQIVPGTAVVSPAADRTESTLTVKVGEGFLLHMAASLTSGTANIGQCLVRARIQQTDAANAAVMAQLLLAYLTDNFIPTWPGSTQQNPVDGRGNLRSITGTNPAVGAEVSETVPAGARWRLISVKAQLVTDATVANRVVRWEIDDGVTSYMRVAGAGSHTASTTGQHTLLSGAAPLSFTSNMSVSTAPADTWLPAGHRITTTTGGIQAGDDWGAPQLYVEEYLEQ